MNMLTKVQWEDLDSFRLACNEEFPFYKDSHTCGATSYDEYEERFKKVHT